MKTLNKKSKILLFSISIGFLIFATICGYYIISPLNDVADWIMMIMLPTWGYFTFIITWIKLVK